MANKNKSSNRTSRKTESRRPTSARQNKKSADRKDRIIQDLQTKIEDLKIWRTRMSRLLRYGQKASTTTNLDRLLELLVEEARVVLEADRATVFILDPKTHELWSKVASGIETIRVPAHRGIVGAVVKSGKIENIRDAYKDKRFNQEVDRVTGYRTRTILAAPMRNTKNQIVGVFQVLNQKKGRAFNRQDEEILTLLADQAAGDVENAQLYQEIRKTAQETIIRLAAAVEFKDHDTRDHLSRMAQYSAIIAEELGFDSEYVETIRMAAPMHDIGKIGVPDAVLNKPGKLNPQEWVEMKKHPIYGAEILKDSENELMKMSATVALCHHERWDGTGYPKGLKGEEIPIEARICSIADVFDALTSKRIYKPAFSLENTLKIIDDENGKMFDPEIVKAFHRALPRIIPIMEKLAPRGDVSDHAKMRNSE